VPVDFYHCDTMAEAEAAYRQIHARQNGHTAANQLARIVTLDDDILI